MIRHPPKSPLFPHTPLFRSQLRNLLPPLPQRRHLDLHHVEPVVEVLPRSEEHTSELQSRLHLVCRLLLEKKKKRTNRGGASERGSNALPDVVRRLVCTTSGS